MLEYDLAGQKLLVLDIIYRRMHRLQGDHCQLEYDIDTLNE